MADLPSVLTSKIQVEETRFKFAVSESLVQKLGKLMNYILDGYIIHPGSIIAYAGLEASIEDGWLVCDGRAVSRTTYANLFTKISTLHGNGDGATTFNLPDYRGAFLRMVDLTTQGQKAYDPNHAARTRPAGATGTAEQPGSFQDDAYEAHNHGVSSNNGMAGGGWSRVGDAQDNTNRTTTEGGDETRPKNWYVLYLIHI